MLKRKLSNVSEKEKHQKPKSYEKNSLLYKKEKKKPRPVTPEQSDICHWINGRALLEGSSRKHYNSRSWAGESNKQIPFSNGASEGFRGRAKLDPQEEQDIGIEPLVAIQALHFRSSHHRLKGLFSRGGKSAKGANCRSSSFGNFDRFRNNSISKPDDSTESIWLLNWTLTLQCILKHPIGEHYVHDGDPIHESGESSKTSNNGGGLGKKMRAISWTMKKKVGKKYIKALSEEKMQDEEDGEGALSYRNSDPAIGTHTEKVSLKASDSMDSLYSGQSSSSGITSCSDGTSNRDSFRLDDDGPYSGPFCGRARVHTDFTPSPYDTDSLKIKKGDIIDIICKTPMGMWTGMLNNKVGNFKFIYVDVISEEEAAPKKIKANRRSNNEKSKTLQEFLERIHLQEYTSTLLLNGYETLEDLKDIKESHLIELNIENPEDRRRLLSAAENFLDEEIIQEQENEPVRLSLSPDFCLNKSQLDDCPRDSGCYISSGNSDNGKEDLESENLSDMVHKITITEPSD
ncbi:SAM domain-containing protein SAMSN-1 [Saguinus oedipus]|uniref:SAM domain-containing protein SAMSN-1 n=1 Tax=Saguinus oedipus TaxID=9490 RepID=A0ABQ9TZ71_SAGOE|nr:SAM domain-containing protein SAMSN-1 [Saguinus oedipus]